MKQNFIEETLIYIFLIYFLLFQSLIFFASKISVLFRLVIVHECTKGIKAYNMVKIIVAFIFPFLFSIIIYYFCGHDEMFMFNLYLSLSQVLTVV